MPVKKTGKIYAKDQAGVYYQIMPEEPDYQGATSESAGKAGFVPAAMSYEKDYFLRGDGTWCKQDNADTIDVDIHTDEEVIPRVEGPYTSDYTYGNSVTLKANVKIDDAYVIGGESLLPTVEQQVNELEGFEVDCSSATNNSEVVIELHFESSITDDFWDAYTYTGTFADLVAAGATGIEMTGGGGVENLITDLNAAGKRVYLTSESIGDGSYRLKPIVVTPEERNVDFVADLVVTKESGLETRVDLKPLLGSVGGKVVMKNAAAAGTPYRVYWPSSGLGEEFPVFFTPPYNNIVIPAVSLYATAEDRESSILSNDTSSGLGTVTTTTTDTVISGINVSASEVFVYVSLAYLENDTQTSPNMITNMESISFQEEEITFSFNTLQDIIDAGGVVPLNWFDVRLLGEIQPVTAKDPCYLSLEDLGNGSYKFTFVPGASVKPVLQLEASSDSEIDLSPINANTVSNVGIKLGNIGTADYMFPEQYHGMDVQFLCWNAAGSFLSRVQGTVTNGDISVTLPEGTVEVICQLDFVLSISRNYTEVYRYEFWFDSLSESAICYSSGITKLLQNAL